MRLARLSFATLAVIALAACSNDATAPELRRPSGPNHNTQTIGSGMKSNADSVAASIEASPANTVSTGAASPI